MTPHLGSGTAVASVSTYYMVAAMPKDRVELAIEVPIGTEYHHFDSAMFHATELEVGAVGVTSTTKCVRSARELSIRDFGFVNLALNLIHRTVFLHKRRVLKLITTIKIKFF